MSTKEKELESTEYPIKQFLDGINVSATLITFGIILYFLPNFFIYETLTSIVSIFSIIIGIMGLSIELSKKNGEGLGLSDLGVGLGLLILWVFIYYYFPYIWINFLSFILLLIGLYGSIGGFLKLCYGILAKGKSKSNVVLNLLVVLIQVIGFISAVITIVSAFTSFL